MPGGAEGGGGLGGALLGLAQLGDGFGQGGEADQQHDRGERAVSGEVGVGGDEPGGVAELVPGRGGRGYAPVGLAGGTVVGVGGRRRARLPSAAAATCSASEAALAASAAAAGFPVAVQYLIRAVASAAVRAAYSHRASASPGVSGESGRAGRVHRWASLGQDRSAASLPPPYQTGSPFLVVSPGSATAYPVTWPGFRVLYRSRTSIPAWSSRAKNSSALAADAAAVATWRRSVVRGGSLAPVAGGFAGLGAGRGAGRGAVGRGGGPQPVPLLGGQAGVADPVPLVHDPGAGPVLAGQHRDQVDVVRAVPDRDPPHRVVFLPARAQPGAVHHIRGRCRPIRASESSRSSGAARIEQCQTGLAYPHLPSASCGSRSSPARRRKSRLPLARSGGSRSTAGGSRR